MFVFLVRPIMKYYSMSKGMFQLEHRNNGAKERWTKGEFPIQGY